MTSLYPPTDKRQLRALLRSVRDAHVEAIGERGRAYAVAAMRRHLAPLLDSNIAAFVAIGSEFPILDSIHGPVALPIVDHRTAPMRFAPWKPGDPLAAGWAGLLQPDTDAIAEPEVVLTPLLGFDRKRDRLGQGAGFYDRFFAERPDVIRIGVAWACQEMDDIPVDPWDVPLHAVVTEKEWIGPPL